MSDVHSTGLLSLVIILMSGRFVQSIPVDKLHKMEGFGSILVETEQKFNWFEAWNECASQNMTLIAVDSAEKSAALTSVLREDSVKVNLWIGGNDLGEKGRFVWSSTGKRFVFSNWSKGNPNNANDLGDCVDIWDTTDFEWNDAACSSKIGFICEENPFLLAARRDLEIKRHFMEQLFTL